jgi:hypothetical protein
LSGTTLRFDRSGRRLIVIEPDEIAIVDVAAAQAIRLAFRGARAVAGFDDELWIATHDDRLVRVDPAGAMLGAPTALPAAAHAVLAPAPCGPPAAVWSASPPVVCSLAAADAAGPVVCTEIGDVDAVIPITGQRAVVVRGSRLILPSGLGVALAPNTQVLGGCVTADGKLLSLLVARGAERQLVVVALGLAQVTQRRAVPPRAAVAIAHGVAAIQIEPRVLRVIDLTTSRELGGVSFGHDVAAFAVGPTGRSIAIRSTTGELELHRIDPLFPRRFAGGRQVAGDAPTAERADAASPRVLLGGAPGTADEPAPPSDLPASAPAADPIAPPTADPIAAPIAAPTTAWPIAQILAPAAMVIAPAAMAIAPAIAPVTDPTTAWRIAPPVSTPVSAMLDLPLPPTLPDATQEIAPVAAAGPAPAPAFEPTLDPVLVHSFSAPTVHATDWLCGTGDYMEGGT